MLADRLLNSSDVVLKRFFQNLGPGVIRLGSNTLDYGTHWSRSGGNSVSTKKIISPAEINTVFDFAENVGWKVSLGLNLLENNPAVSADEAEYAAGKGRDLLMSFDLGFEPDGWYGNGRSNDWTVANYNSEFGAYVQAIKNKVSNAKIAGPATVSKDLVFYKNFLNMENGGVSIATHDLYPDSICDSKIGKKTIDCLLSKSAAAEIGDIADKLVLEAKSKNIPVRIGETSSLYAHGIIDTFASSLYMADYLFNLASRGISGVNIYHGNLVGTNPYYPNFFKNTETGIYEVRPLYYGALFFHLAGEGSVMPADIDNPAANIGAYAIKGNDGITRLALVNKDINKSAIVKVGADDYVSATGTRLSAASYLEKNCISLGGGRVGSDGIWRLSSPEKINLANGYFQIPLPAASAIMVTFVSRAKIACFGDSITIGNNSSFNYCSRLKTLGEYNTYNHGVSGNTAGKLLKRISEVTGKGYDKTILLVGTNDITNTDKVESKDDYYHDLLSIVQKLKDDGQKILISTFPPRNLPSDSQAVTGGHCKTGDYSCFVEWNNIVRQVSYEKNICYADIYDSVFKGAYIASMFSDWGHPNETSHGEMAQVYADAIANCKPFDCNAQPGECYSFSGCISKTCAAMGNYECGSWSDGCGNALNCGTCVSGKICNSNGQCVTSGGGGGGGGGGGTTIITKKEEPKTSVEMTRAQIITKINEIKQLLIKLIIQLIAELQKQLAGIPK